MHAHINCVTSLSGHPISGPDSDDTLVAFTLGARIQNTHWTQRGQFDISTFIAVEYALNADFFTCLLSCMESFNLGLDSSGLTQVGTFIHGTLYDSNPCYFLEFQPDIEGVPN